jgi:hypothetical protein
VNPLLEAGVVAALIVSLIVGSAAAGKSWQQARDEAAQARATAAAEAIQVSQATALDAQATRLNYVLRAADVQYATIIKQVPHVIVVSEDAPPGAVAEPHITRGVVRVHDAIADRGVPADSGQPAGGSGAAGAARPDDEADAGISLREYVDTDDENLRRLVACRTRFAALKGAVPQQQSVP